MIEIPPMPEKRIPIQPMSSASTKRSSSRACCEECRLSKLCLPLSLSHDEVGKLSLIVQNNIVVKKGECLYDQDQDFDAIFAVRSGSLKASSLEKDGMEQITGFFFPGEVLGLDGISTQKHVSQVMALEDSHICKIPFKDLEPLSSDIPSLQRQLFNILSTEINRDQQMMMLLGSRSSKERVASFLLSLSSRQSKRGLSGLDITLTMTRQEIGNYLGLTNETMSRILSRFQKSEIIKTKQKNINILNLEKLKSEAHV